MNGIEGPWTVNEWVVQNWFKRFNEGDISTEVLLLWNMTIYLK